MLTTSPHHPARIYHKEPLHMAHRSHAYQCAVAHGASHQRVTVTALLITIILLPVAYLASRYPAWNLWILLSLLVVGGYYGGIMPTKNHKPL